VEKRFFEVQVSLDEARQCDAAIRIDFLGSGPVEMFLDGRNPTVLDSDIDERLIVFDPDPADNHIHIGRAPYENAGFVRLFCVPYADPWIRWHLANHDVSGLPPCR
jgi:hypothetical protein